jgi:serine/threonine protein kinase
MNAFHKEGYIYRDIKASNFMINQKGKVTMIDLGKAKHIGD